MTHQNQVTSSSSYSCTLSLMTARLRRIATSWVEFTSHYWLPKISQNHHYAILVPCHLYLYNAVVTNRRGVLATMDTHPADWLNGGLAKRDLFSKTMLSVWRVGTVHYLWTSARRPQFFMDAIRKRTSWCGSHHPAWAPSRTDSWCKASSPNPDKSCSLVFFNSKVLLAKFYLCVSDQPANHLA